MTEYVSLIMQGSIIRRSSDAGKVRTGAMYAMNALKNGWMEDVKIFVFGPAEHLLLNDPDLQRAVKEYQQMDEKIIACKAIADRDGITDGIAKQGVSVEYVGKMISDLIKDGYVPMVW